METMSGIGNARLNWEGEAPAELGLANPKPIYE